VVVEKSRKRTNERIPYRTLRRARAFPGALGVWPPTLCNTKGRRGKEEKKKSGI
jgi:hypothetical protein